MKRSRLTQLVAAGLALGLVAAACGSGTATTAPETSSPNAAATDEPQVPGALDLEAATADGGTINLADYAGQDVMLWMWAPW